MDCRKTPPLRRSRTRFIASDVFARYIEIGLDSTFYNEDISRIQRGFCPELLLVQETLRKCSLKVWVARRPPGFAFVEFEDARDAEDAVRSLDGSRICGVRARVEMSHGRECSD